MNKRQRRPAQDEQSVDAGFSLVELLIVIVVLGILTTVTVFAVRGITDKGEAASCDADVRTLTSAAGAYQITNSVESIPANGLVDGDEYERTLVQAGLIRAVSSLHDVAADGSVSIVATACVPPATTP